MKSVFGSASIVSYATAAEKKRITRGIPSEQRVSYGRWPITRVYSQDSDARCALTVSPKVVQILLNNAFPNSILDLLHCFYAYGRDPFAH